MKEPTELEKLTDNTVSKLTLTTIAALAGTPIAALLPVLSGTLAGGRHKQRVEEELIRMDSILRSHESIIDDLTDSQYKLINEIILTILQNTEDEKKSYLMNAVTNGLNAIDINQTLVAQVSRALRDMTAGELAFVINHFDVTIMIGPVTGDPEEFTQIIDRNSDEMIYVSGLIGLGVLHQAGSTINDAGKYVFAEFCSELKGLVMPVNK